MHYILESIFVGLYSTIIFQLCSIIHWSNDVLFFMTGFFKHYIGYISGIHKWYYENGFACKNIISSKKDNIANTLLESILEGSLFLLFGKIILFYQWIPFAFIPFFIGVFLHILFEIINVHHLFCRERIIL